MKKSIYLIVAFIVTTVCSSQEIVKYSKSGFEADFPCEPQQDKQVVNAEGYDVTLNMYMCVTDAVVLIVSESPLPGGIAQNLDKSSSDSFLSGTKNGAMNAMAAQLGSKFEQTSEEFITLQDYNALKVVGKLGGANTAALFIDRKGQLYQILVIGDEVQKAYEAFAKSFKLI